MSGKAKKLVQGYSKRIMDAVYWSNYIKYDILEL